MTEKDSECTLAKKGLYRAAERLACELANWLAGLKGGMSFLAQTRFVNGAKLDLTMRIMDGQPWAEAARDFACEHGHHDIIQALDIMRLVEYNRCVNALDRMHLASTRRLSKVGNWRRERACELVNDSLAQAIIVCIPLPDLLPNGRKTWRGVCADRLRDGSLYAAADAVLMDPLRIVELAESERYDKQRELERAMRRRS